MAACRGWCTLNSIFYHQVNFLVNMESLQDNHDKHAPEFFYDTSTSVLDSYILPLHFPKQSFQNVVWPFYSSKEE